MDFAVPPSAVRRARPLTQCITNTVSCDIMANVLLAAGAAPAMVSSAAEVADFARAASALLINIGTLKEDDVKAMQMAADAMVALNKPWVLDPVAVGATPHRTSVAAGLATRRPTVIKGNASEVVALAAAVGAAAADPGAGPRGVDSTLAADAAVGAARALANHAQAVVVVTGETDYVVSPCADGGAACPTLAVRGGHPLLPVVTATGCSLGALIASYCATAAVGGRDLADRCPGGHTRAAHAAASAAAAFGAAASKAGQAAAGPGSFRVALLDALHAQADEDVLAASVVESVLS